MTSYTQGLQSCPPNNPDWAAGWDTHTIVVFLDLLIENVYHPYSPIGSYFLHNRSTDQESQ